MFPRPRAHSKGLSDWNPLKDEFENSTHASQTPDIDVQDGVQLDHNRLYIRNIPTTLNHSGLHTVFSKYGTLTECFLSNDVNKRYALVQYQSQGEAKLAMTEMNKKEPFNFVIHIAHAHIPKRTLKQKERVNNSGRNSNAEPSRQRTISHISHTSHNSHTLGGDNYTDRKVMANGDIKSSYMDILETDVDDVEEDDIELKMEQLKLRKAQRVCKQRYDAVQAAETRCQEACNDDPDLDIDLEMAKLSLKRAQLDCKKHFLAVETIEKRNGVVKTPLGGRRLTPDGRIVLNVTEGRTSDVVNKDSSSVKGANNVENSISRVPSLLSVPSRKCINCGAESGAYCARCGLVPYCGERCQREDWDRRHSGACHNLQQHGYIQPLRQPRAPASEMFGPPDMRGVPGHRGHQAHRSPEKGAATGRYQRSQPREHGDKENDNRQAGARPPLRHRQYKPEPAADAPVKRVTDNCRTDKPVSVDRVNPMSVNKVKPVTVNKVVAETTQKVPAAPDSTTKDLVPNKCVVDTIELGDAVTLVAACPAAECAIDAPGAFVCISLHRQQQASYDMLCNEYLADCSADTEEYKVTPGETFSVLIPEEKAWFRARCLTPTTAAILDCPRILTLTPATNCKKLHHKYAAIPEFCCVLQADNVKVGDQMFWKLTARNPDGTNSGELMDLATRKSIGCGVVTRWLPKLEIAVAPKATNGAKVTPALPTPSSSIPAPPTLAASTPAPSATAASTLGPSVPTPAAKPLIPDKCVIEMVEVGDSVMLSVERAAAQCATDAHGFVCLSLHLQYQHLFNVICDEYVAACVADPDECKVTPGDTFSILHPEEDTWYRARCLTSTTAAILDSANVLALTPATKCKKLQEKYAAIPEFCCLLQTASDNVKIGDQIRCEFLTKDTATGAITARLVNEGTGDQLGEGTLRRWLPKVQPALPALYVSGCNRPALASGAPVVLLATEPELGLAYVRPDTPDARRAYDAVVQDVLTYALQALPLQETPEKTDLVLARYTDGLYYRAIVAKTNVKLNRFLLEYVDIGKMHKASMEEMRLCPGRFSPQLRPAVTSVARLPPAATPAARDYLARLLQQKTKLVLTLANGTAEAPSGSDAVLTVDASRECVNKLLEDLSTPGWKKMEMNGKDIVLDGEVLMSNRLVYTELLPEGGKLTVLSADTLVLGVMAACMADQAPLLDLILGDLTDRIGAYVESKIGKEPYLPRCEELCIAKYEPTNQWFRAIFCSQNSDGDRDTANVLFIDFGNLYTLSIRDVRKMVPEFVQDVPALSCYVEIKDFPTNVTEAARDRALKFMGMEDGEFGQLDVTRCTLKEGEPGCYVVEAPELLAAVGPV